MAITLLQDVSAIMLQKEFQDFWLQTGTIRDPDSSPGPPNLEAALRYKTLLEHLPKAIRFNMTNVEGWLGATDVSASDVYGMLRELPICVPPYPYTYIEWAPPSQGYVVGLYVISTVQGADGYKGSEDDGWTVMAYLFVGNKDSTFHIGVIKVFLEYDGKIAQKRGDQGEEDALCILGNFSPEVDALMKINKEFDGYVRRASARSIAILFFGFSLLHCRNVQAVDTDPKKGMTRQQLRAQERRGEPFLMYKTLTVSPIRAYRKSGQEEEGTGKKRRFHLVRGHFSEYGPKYGKGKLFGRLEGRFYVPPFSKGDPEVGIVVKDYKIAQKKES